MTSNGFEVSLYIPKQHLLATQAHMVVAPGVDGYFGILSLHSPVVSLLKPGLLKVHVDQQTVMKYVISYGVARINDNKFALMVEDAILLDNINTVLANQSIDAYQKDLSLSSSLTQKQNLSKKIDFLKACVELRK